MSKVASGVCLGHSGLKAVEFKISVNRKKSASRTLALRRLQAAQGASKVSMEGTEVHQCWSVFKYHLLRGKEQRIKKFQKPSR